MDLFFLSQNRQQKKDLPFQPLLNDSWNQFCQIGLSVSRTSQIEHHLSEFFAFFVWPLTRQCLLMCRHIYINNLRNPRLQKAFNHDHEAKVAKNQFPPKNYQCWLNVFFLAKTEKGLKVIRCLITFALNHCTLHQRSQKTFLELSHRVLLGHINLCIENLHFCCVLNLLYKGVTLSKLALMMTLTLTAAVGLQDHTDPS